MRLPDDEELLAYLDGEVPPGRRAEIDRLLRVSPTVSERLAGLRHDADVCDRVLTEAQPPLPSADAEWYPLAARLQPRPARLRPRALWTGIAAAACACLALFLRVGSPPSISANDVLVRAGRAEAARLKSVAVPVVHRRLRIASRGQSATLDTWTATASGQSRERFEAEKGAHDDFQADLNRMLLANRLDRRYLLSPSAYREWRSGIRASDETLAHRRDDRGDDLYSISTTVEGAGAEGQITHSEFVVRAADWQPVSNHLRVRTARGEAEYEIREVEYAVLARASLPAGYFDPPARPRLPVHAHVRHLPPPSALPAPESALPAASPEDEIAAHYAVHRAGACDGDAVSIQHAPDGALEVAGTVSEAQRIERIRMLLEGRPSVRVNLRAVPRAPSAAPPADPQASPEAEALRISIDSFLALIASDSAALSRLVSSPAAAEWSAASPESRAQLREILQEHLAALDGNMRQVAGLLQPSMAPSDAGARASGADWRGQIAEIAEAAARLAVGRSPDAQSWFNWSARAGRTRAAVDAAFRSDTASAAR